MLWDIMTQGSSQIIILLYLTTICCAIRSEDPLKSAREAIRANRLFFNKDKLAPSGFREVEPIQKLSENNYSYDFLDYKSSESDDSIDLGWPMNQFNYHKELIALSKLRADIERASGRGFTENPKWMGAVLRYKKEVDQLMAKLERPLNTDEVHYSLNYFKNLQRKLLKARTITEEIIARYPNIFEPRSEIPNLREFVNFVRSYSKILYYCDVKLYSGEYPDFCPRYRRRMRIIDFIHENRLNLPMINPSYFDEQGYESATSKSVSELSDADESIDEGIEEDSMFMEENEGYTRNEVEAHSRLYMRQMRSNCSSSASCSKKVKSRS